MPNLHTLIQATNHDLEPPLAGLLELMFEDDTRLVWDQGTTRIDDEGG